VALRLSQKFPIEIISADSRQMIRQLQIGTAKPTSEEQAAVRFHLIDLIEPGESYSAFEFIEACDQAVSEIRARDHSPVVVGGTGLYLKALTEGVIDIEPGSADIRDRLEQEMEQLGTEVMHQRLQAIDPDEATRIHANNKIRVIRALEIYELTGKSKTELIASDAYKRSRYEYAYFCLQPEREALYAAINDRVDSMMQAGMLDEVERLIKNGLQPQLRRANVIGYEELLDYFEDRLSLDEAVALIKQNSRRYAKRQMTWFRHQADCQFFEGAESLTDALSARLSGGY
jgi:tRNA dimethylallyltransferase